MLTTDNWLLTTFPGGAVQLLREGYHERLFLLSDEQEGLIVRKQAKSEVDGTLLTEIVWLEELPPALQPYFPRVLRSGKGNGQALFYDMPYFDQEWVLLSELILTRAIAPTHALTLIAQVMQVMFEGIFPMIYPEEEAGYPEQLVLLLERCLQRIPQLPAFTPFIFTEVLTLNGVRQWNVFPLLEALKSDSRVQEKLRPQTIRKVHGDLYPENILIYLPSLRWSVPRVMLLDPIAAIGLSRGDFAMDIAKFKSWLSAELLALRLGLFSVQKEQGNLPSFVMTLQAEESQLRALSDGVLLSAFAHLLDTAPWTRAICEADPGWWQRVSFYEALYALSMVPLVPPWQSLARFLVGVRHLHNFVCDISDQPSSELSVASRQLLEESSQ